LRYIKRLKITNNSDGFVTDTILDAANETQIKLCTEPWLTQDNNGLYFTANKDIWKMVGKNKPLYFHSFDKNVYENNIYYSRFLDRKCTKRIKTDKLGDAGDTAIRRYGRFLFFYRLDRI
jgi:hypothetical protein